MGPIWGRQDPGGPHSGPMNFAIWGFICRKQVHKMPLFVALFYIFSKVSYITFAETDT